jgi:hypothetical protein
MTIGGSQSFQLIVDTGSASLEVASAGCASCVDAGVSNLYQPGPLAVEEDASVNELFGAESPSGFAGQVYSDWVGVGASPKMARVNIVAIQTEGQFLVGTCGPSGAPQGVVGFAPLDTVSGTNLFFDQVVANGAISNVFATRLCSTGGTLWLGGYDPAYVTATPVYTPLLSGTGVEDDFFSVSLTSISGAGATVPIPTGAFVASMLDTGSSNSTLPPAAYSALTSAILADPAFAQVFGGAAAAFFADSANCAQVSQTKEQLDAMLPPLTLTFGSSPGVSVQATATESYLLTYGANTWCPAIVPLAPGPNFPGIAAHLGAPILASNVVIFDRANKRVGFAPHTACP